MRGYQVKNNQKNGFGVFATKNFKKDELIIKVDGETTEAKSLSVFAKEIQDHVFPYDKVGDIVKYVLPQSNSAWQYLNHSCNPNAGIRHNREIVAINPISKGDEIVFDYAMNNIDGYEMKCCCGSSNCRGKVTTFDSLDLSTQKKYRDYVLDYIKSKY